MKTAEFYHWLSFIN